MWTSHFEKIDQHTTKVKLSAGQPLSYREVIDLWLDSEGFRAFFASQIRESEYEAFFWETPAVTTQTLDRPFEYVLVESTELRKLTPDSSPFSQHFRAQPSADILTFPNLGGDAILVVPAPLGDKTSYTHLAQFIRHAPGPQIDAFWRATCVAMKERISETPTWLSTAGTGVSWLHLRLDSRPKYYRHAPYRRSA